MEFIRNIFVVIISSLMGASLSKIFDIFAGRRFYNSSFNFWWSIKFYGAIILIGLFLLAIIFLISYIIKISKY